MIKPGGYIPWDALDFPGTYVKNSNHPLQTPATHQNARGDLLAE